MSNLFEAGLTIEKFAAFLDGNVDDFESQSIMEQISNDPMLEDIYEASQIVDDLMDTYRDALQMTPNEVSQLKVPEIIQDDRAIKFGLADSIMGYPEDSVIQSTLLSTMNEQSPNITPDDVADDNNDNSDEEGNSEEDIDGDIETDDYNEF